MRKPSMVGPKTIVGQKVHEEKYRGRGESFREFANRICTALQDDHDHYMSLRETQLDQRYLFAGRVQAAMGSLKNVTALNCFVSATIHDSFVDGPTQEELDSLETYKHAPLSIMDTAKQAACTMRQGGGIGFDASTLRPAGDIIRGVDAKTDGPLAFAPILDAVCRATSSAGNRRGAMMLTMRCDHPDIEAFINAKQAVQDIPYQFRPFTGFNMSVLVTNKLMEHKASGKPFPLMFNGKIYREVDPVALWEKIMRSTYDWAEPGVIFIDRINEMNNLHYCETISATNPCGEQPLPPYGSCLLGSFNLVKYISRNETFDYDKLKADIPHVVRAMDNVIDRTRYPLLEQKIEAQRKRRIGIGVTGLSNAIEFFGHPYGSEGYIQMQDEIQSFITREVYLASTKLAKEKGPFPLFDSEKYLKSKFVETMDDEVRDHIKRYGIRNSHLTSIAPTGTISICADNISSGIEPVLAYRQKRRIIMPEGPVTHDMYDYGFMEFGIHGKRAKNVTAKEHISVLCTAQKHTDSAVSKTCNVPTDYSYEDFKHLYDMAFENGAKGCTTYRPNGNYPDVIEENDIEIDREIELNGACGWDPVTGQRIGACAD